MKCKGNGRISESLLRGAAVSATAFAALTGALGATSSAFAQDSAQEGAQGVEDIVVTAQRRESQLQETPSAVSAFTAETLEAMPVSNVGDVVEFVPNVTRTSGPSGGNDGFFFVRGIGQVDSNPAGDPGVGMYIDDVYMGRVQGASFDALDIERVEVLRGPQGTLFGRNTIGGAINVITADPGDELGGRIRVGLGERERREVFFTGNVPVSENAGFSVSAFTRQQDGFSTNVYSGDTFGDVDTWGARIVGRFDINPNWDIRITADTTQGDGAPPPTVMRNFFPFGGGGASPLQVNFIPAMGGFVSDSQSENFVSIEPVSELDASGASLTSTWRGDWATLRSITAWREVSQYITNDFDGGPYSFYDGFFDTDQHQFSQEFQLSGSSFSDRLDWLFGLYYFDETSDHTNGICMGTNTGVQGVAVQLDGRCIENNQRFSLDVTSWAAFTNLTYALTDRLSINFGGRFSQEEKNQDYDFFIDNTDGVANGFFIPAMIVPTIVASVDDSWSSFTPRVGLNFQANEDLLLYASYAQGFKSGGFDGRPTPGFPINSYDPETIDTYELGLKSDWFDNRLRLNVAAFFSQYDDIQLLVNGGGFFTLLNAGDAEIRGAEFELAWVPTEQLRIDASLGYVDHEYVRLAPGAAPAGIDLNDKLPLTPEWTGSLSVSYEIPLGNLGDLTLRGDYSYQSEISYGAPNGAFELEDGYGLLGVRATLATPGERVQLSVFGRNVTDEFYYSNSQDVSGALGVAFSQVGAPAEWGAELSLRF